MRKFDRRIERLESILAMKHEPRVIVKTFNPDDDDTETPYAIQLSPGGVWAFAVRGGPFSDEEIHDLRKSCKDEQANLRPGKKI